MFIRCKEGVFVSLAQVEAIRPVYATQRDEPQFSAGALMEWAVSTVGGRQYTADRHEFREEFLTSQTISAAAGERALVITVVDCMARPTEQDMSARWLPIVAWRIPSASGAPPQAVLLEEIASNEITLIEMTDGRLLLPHGREYEDEAEAAAAILRDLQEECDGKEAAPPADARTSNEAE
ncbi:hypothetical protein [Sabulicella glaciei]|uniref:Uncharacterized protein n=1 Tax=Sabulicella glaciei TaxID=2984948 RepID=A0ABT3NRD4_9PROT|nr:hypothetical protein [Roseococcus sp. MDT2-1-1]MCW8084719.1 hypothetical protein [Roseococcus sp. MDT2-1-1]